jgi:hypothetical protein
VKPKPQRKKTLTLTLDLEDLAALDRIYRSYPEGTTTLTQVATSLLKGALQVRTQKGPKNE